MRCSAQFTPPPLPPRQHASMRGTESCVELDEQLSSVVNDALASVIPLSCCRRARAHAPSRRLHCRAALHSCSAAVADQETTRLADMHAFTNTDPRQNMFTQRSKDGEEVWWAALDAAPLCDFVRLAAEFLQCARRSCSSRVPPVWCPITNQ